MIVLRWVFGHRDSSDSFVEVPDADIGPVWAGLEAMTGRPLPPEGAPLIPEEFLAAVARAVGREWVAERFGGLAGRDGDEWWEFIAVGSFHGGLSAERVAIGASS